MYTKQMIGVIPVMIESLIKYFVVTSTEQYAIHKLQSGVMKMCKTNKITSSFRIKIIEVIS